MSRRRSRNRATRGDHNVISDQSGFKLKRSETSLTWKNTLVETRTEFEVKHPQQELRVRQERIAVQVTRTPPEDPPLGPILTVDQIL